MRPEPSAQERGEFGALEGALALAIVTLTLGIALAMATRSGNYHYAALQSTARIAADNAVVDLGAVGAYDRSAYALIFSGGGTTAGGLLLPPLSPFPGASLPPQPSAPPVQIGAKAYEDSSGRFEAAIDLPESSAGPAVHVPIAIVQSTSGTKDCPAALKGVPGTGC